MARAVALVAESESPVFEALRFAIATACPLALIFAGRFLPF
ncbi:hypothetical protein [Tsuneonella amylolytica]|nr:hypothetical protein [Tsuneonella amylolytica]